MNKNLRFFPVLLCLFLTASCLNGEAPTNYADPKHWLSQPADPDKPVDVFYLYPTVWRKVTPDEPDTCAIDNPKMLEGSKIALAMQGSVFEPYANIYAPYYRQGDAFYILSRPFEEQVEFLEEITEKDVMAAFDYYIRHLNKGRPFILAGHSQGTMMLRPILFKYMKKHPDVYRRMIAAYMIGFGVTEQDLKDNPHLKFAEGADDTGVIISYNTQGPDLEQENPVVLPGSISINPISWTRGDREAPASENLGSAFMGPNGEMQKRMNFADARVDLKQGVVICSTKECASVHNISGLFSTGIYHGSDYAFYYYNLRQNAADRIKAYFEKQKK